MTVGARQEWRKYWTLPLAGALGNSLTVLLVYSLGIFMEPLTNEFGWNRAEISAGITVANFTSLGFGLVSGMLVDRFGPRRVGIIGVALTCSATALLGTATGTLTNWYLLWALVALGGAGVGPFIWTSAVASRFDASRGLAIAIVVSGAGLSATILPSLTAWLLQHYGWRGGFFGIGAIWAVVVIPVLLLFFRGAYDGRVRPTKAQVKTRTDAMPGLTLAEGMRSAPFWRLGLAGGFFAFVAIGLIVHFVPILKGSGLDLATAAGVAGTIGLASLVGRFGTGFLLDRFNPRLVAAVAFALPTVAVALLLSGGSPLVLTIAAFVVGLSLGAELDVTFYLATRYFGLKSYGVLMSAMMGMLAIGMALGPVSAGAIFDRTGSYANFLWLSIPLVLIASLMVGTLKRHPDWGDAKSDGGGH
jgi:MFS family permease